jgi:hypothetical protein
MIKSDKECVEMLDEICERASDILTEWESNFVDSLYGQTGFSYKQKEIIDRIHEEKVGLR